MMVFMCGVVLPVHANHTGNPADHAGTTGVNSNAGQTGANSNTGQTGVNNTGFGSSVSILNPLGDQTLAGFARDIIAVLLVFITPIIVLAYIFAGFKYVISQGKPEEIKKATQWLLYISIGAVLALGAYVILAVIENTINAFRV